VPANQRAVVLLHDVLDLPVDQVAEQLGLPASTVRGRLARARAALARHVTADAVDAREEVSHRGRR
jgi:RNA polymerase sigma-70 factor (ECF subfamily)